MKKTWKYDILLLGILLAVGAVCMFAALNGKKGNTLEIRVSGRQTASFSLSEDRTYTIMGADGGTNVLVIENGTARIAEASCPDGLCVNMGPISKAGQSVICLPNEVVIEITNGSGTAENNDVDVIAGGAQ